MAKNLIIGRYIKTQSLIHQLDPRTKLISIIIFITLLMRSTSWQQYLILVAYTYLAMFLTRIPILIFLKGIRPLLRIIIITAGLQIFLTSGVNNYWQFGPIIISEVGVWQAGTIFIRFTLIILMTSVIGLSTKPLELTAGIAKLLFPLKILGLAVADFALMMAIALRFIPTLFEEARRLKAAQEARGMQFDEGNFLVRMRKVIPLLVPIFVGSFYRAQELANALDVRGYVGAAKKTQFNQLKFTINDLSCFLILGVIIISYLL